MSANASAVLVRRLPRATRPSTPFLRGGRASPCAPMGAMRLVPSRTSELMPVPSSPHRSKRPMPMKLASQGRSALANERQGKACKRNESRNAAHDDERLKHDGHGAAYGHHGRHVAFRASRGRETANAQTQIQKQHGGSAEQARFFGDGGEDEVGLNDGDVFGEAVADAYAHHAAIGQGIERLAQLIAIARCVRERVEPRCSREFARGRRTGTKTRIQRRQGRSLPLNRASFRSRYKA